LAISVAAGASLAAWLTALGVRAQVWGAYSVLDVLLYSLPGLVALLPLTVVAAWSTALSLRSRPLVFLLLLLTSPIVVLPTRTAVRASLQYQRGEAEIQRGANFGMGGGSLRDYGGLDLPTRIPVHFSSTTCGGLAAHQELGFAIHNRTLRILDSAFGPMVGTYQGRLPSPKSLQRMLVAGGQCLAGDLESSFSFEGSSYATPTVVSQDLTSTRVIVLEGRVAAFEACGDHGYGLRCWIHVVDLATDQTLSTNASCSNEPAPCGSP